MTGQTPARPANPSLAGERTQSGPLTIAARALLSSQLLAWLGGNTLASISFVRTAFGKALRLSEPRFRLSYCFDEERTRRTKHSSCNIQCSSAPQKHWVVRKPQQLIQHSSLSRRTVLCGATTEQEETSGQQKGEELQNDDSEMARKQREADQLRAAEKFMVVGTGEAECTSCGFIYDPRKGDPEYPVGPGTQFGSLPGDWQCPICGAGKRSFQNKAKTLAGFEQNMQYGFGTNTMTSGQKSLLIYGSLIAFFGLFLFGYLLQ